MSPLFYSKNNPKKLFIKIKKTLYYAYEQIDSFVFNLENMQKENQLQTGK